jgi:hypothetical protein
MISEKLMGKFFTIFHVRTYKTEEKEPLQGLARGPSANCLQQMLKICTLYLLQFMPFNEV